MESDADVVWMTRALELAAAADYATSPNPMVGAVVLDPAGRPVGEGLHRRAGEPHAEIVALGQAGARARGGTLYVNLEPHDHQGRTAPCSVAIIEAGIARVVAAVQDPNPATDGAGFRRLRAAGVRVDVGLLAEEATELNRFFLHRQRTGLPYVTSKFAISLDGRIATSSGQSRWISGPVSREHGHLLRHQHDAILVGSGTVLEDDPALSARPRDHDHPRQPVRVILDSRLRTPPGAAAAGGALIFASAPVDLESRRRLEARGAEIMVCDPGPDGRPDPRAVLEALAARAVISVLVEGGAAVHWSFLSAGLVSRIHAYLAPLVIGGTAAPGPVGGPGFERLADALRIGPLSAVAMGEDIMIRAECSPG